MFIALFVVFVLKESKGCFDNFFHMIDAKVVNSVLAVHQIGSLAGCIRGFAAVDDGYNQQFNSNPFASSLLSQGDRVKQVHLGEHDAKLSVSKMLFVHCWKKAKC